MNTSEEAIYELFSKCGEISMLKMGLNNKKKTACGFCFVEYFTREDARLAAEWLNNTTYVQVHSVLMERSSEWTGILDSLRVDNTGEGRVEDRSEMNTEGQTRIERTILNTEMAEGLEIEATPTINLCEKGSLLR